MHLVSFWSTRRWENHACAVSAGVQCLLHAELVRLQLFQQLLEACP